MKLLEVNGAKAAVGLHQITTASGSIRKRKQDSKWGPGLIYMKRACGRVVNSRSQAALAHLETFGARASRGLG